MSTRNNQPLPPELIQAGLMQLTEARSAAMGGIASELQGILAATIAARDTDKAPQGVPEWAASTFAEANAAGSANGWKTVRAALARRTADLIARTVLAEGITGGSLAGFLGLDLYALSYEAWAEIVSVGPAMAEEAK